ncbi:MAG: hypothetical protein CR994_00860 [Maribacter sp.]|nr:MAG: hypothetical protein CR994_00860 [Maribacter sp.]
MENQYCKVGSVTSILAENQAITLLEYQYQCFMERAANIKYGNTRLREFFESKAEKTKKKLDELS